jgi:DNA mismatch endonuclease, patch repair protein
MPDVFNRKKRSLVMAAIPSKGNKDTELVFLRILKKYRISGWRRHLPLTGRPDFVFRRERVVVFVDGCFWHNCPMHGRSPTSNQEYWSPKFARNKARDRKVTKDLRTAGWKVVRIWEHDLKRDDLVAARIRRLVLQDGIRT